MKSVLAALVLALGFADAGKVKAALFGSLFGKAEADRLHGDADQQELAAWLKEIGFGQYASKEWLDTFDDKIAYDSIEDMSHLVADDDYKELEIEKEVAIKIQAAARRHVLKHFLSSAPLPPNASPGVFDALLEPLIAAGYDEPDDVADLDEDEAKEIGLDPAHFKLLVTYAEEFEARELLHIIMTTYEPPEGKPNPFASEVVWRPLIDALIKVGVRNLADISMISPQPGIPKELLTRLKADERVKAHAGKQEL